MKPEQGFVEQLANMMLAARARTHAQQRGESCVRAWAAATRRTKNKYVIRLRECGKAKRRGRNGACLLAALGISR